MVCIWHGVYKTLDAAAGMSIIHTLALEGAFIFDHRYVWLDISTYGKGETEL